MANDGKGTVLLPGERETISMPRNKVSFVHRADLAIKSATYTCT
jgi:hypothetical protein